MRHAISPRLAIKTLLKVGGNPVGGEGEREGEGRAAVVATCHRSAFEDIMGGARKHTTTRVWVPMDNHDCMLPAPQKVEVRCHNVTVKPRTVLSKHSALRPATQGRRGESTGKDIHSGHT